MSVTVSNTTSNLSGKEIVLTAGTHTVTGAWTFDRDPSAPFLVTSGSAKVDNLNADQLDGIEGAAFLQLTGGTMVGNLLATDNTYDIGATGATRFRDLFLARNAVVGGTLNVSGITTLGTVSAGAVTATAVTADSLDVNRPRNIHATDFGTAGRFAVTNVAGGTSTFGNYLSLQTSATISSSTQVLFPLLWALNGGGVFTTVPGEFSVAAAVFGFGTDFQIYLGLGNPTVGGAGITYTTDHIGFKIVRAASGTTSVFGTVATGGVETATAALTTIVSGDPLDLFLRLISPTSVKFYWRKNGSAWSSATEITTNIPTSTTNQNSSFAISNAGVATTTELDLRAAAYVR